MGSSIETDHNGPHGYCRLLDDWSPDCTCPDWQHPSSETCICCQGTLEPGLTPEDVIVFAHMRSRMKQAIRRMYLPLRPLSGSTTPKP